MQAAERASPLFNFEQSPSLVGKYNSKNLLFGLFGMGSFLFENRLCGIRVSRILNTVKAYFRPFLYLGIFTSCKIQQNAAG